MVNPVVYGPRYGQFGELGARWDNYLGRGHFAQSINPATSAAKDNAGKVSQCNAANQDGVSGGQSAPGGIGKGTWSTLPMGNYPTLKPKQSLLTFVLVQNNALS